MSIVAADDPVNRSRRTLRLLFVVKELHNAAGGAERVLATVTAGLARLGHEVVVASFDEEGCEPFYGFDRSVRRIRLRSGRTGTASSPIDIARRTAVLRRFAVDLAPDVAIGFMNSAFVPLALGLVGTSIPVVASEHIGYTHYDDRPVERLLLSLVKHMAARITVPSEKIRAGFPSSFLSTMVAVENPVAEPGIVPGGGVDRPLLLAAGRFTPQKDFATLIAAFTTLADRFPHWHLRILGDGLLRPRLEAQIAEARLGERVFLPGIRTDMAHEYAQAGVFVMSSRYESMGLVTAEALAHGVPAIGFVDCDGTNELIRPGINGLLVASTDRVASLAEGLAAMLSDDAARARFAAAAPATVQHLLGDAVVVKWDDLLREVADGR